MSTPNFTGHVVHPDCCLRIPAGSVRGRGDCTVVALSILLEITYLQAVTLMTKYGRLANGKWPKRCLHFRASLSKILNGHMVARHGSVGKFVRTHPQGKFLIWVRGHVFAVVNGIIYDHTNKPSRHISGAWSVGTRTMPSPCGEGK